MKKNLQVLFLAALLPVIPVFADEGGVLKTKERDAVIIDDTKMQDALEHHAKTLEKKRVRELKALQTQKSQIKTLELRHKAEIAARKEQLKACKKEQKAELKSKKLELKTQKIRDKQTAKIQAALVKADVKTQKAQAKALQVRKEAKIRARYKKETAKGQKAVLKEQAKEELAVLNEPERKPAKTAEAVINEAPARPAVTAGKPAREHKYDDTDATPMPETQIAEAEQAQTPILEVKPDDTDAFFGAEKPVVKVSDNGKYTVFTDLDKNGVSINEFLQFSDAQNEKFSIFYYETTSKLDDYSKKIKSKEKFLAGVKKTAVGGQSEKANKLGNELDALMKERDDYYNRSLAKFNSMLTKKQSIKWQLLQQMGYRFLSEIE